MKTVLVDRVEVTAATNAFSESTSLLTTASYKGAASQSRITKYRSAITPEKRRRRGQAKLIQMWRCTDNGRDGEWSHRLMEIEVRCERDGKMQTGKNS